MPTQRSFHIYNNLGYFFIFWLIVLMPFGFYKSYLSVILQPHPSIMHIHFALMILWIITLIAQPFLIKYKKFATHRLIGKFSYVLLPCLLIAAWLMTRYSYYHFIDELNKSGAVVQNHLSNDQVLQQAAGYETIAIVYIAWLATFYFSGIANRKNTPVHSRFMLAAGLTMVGPAVDRIWFYALGIEKFPGNIPLETFTFLIIDIILATLLIRDYKRKKSVSTLWACLIIYLTGEVLELTIQHSPAWKNIVSFLMRPSP